MPDTFCLFQCSPASCQPTLARWIIEGLPVNLDSRWRDYDMRKGFTRKPQADEPATQGKNYITPSGLERLKDEHTREPVTEVVAWAIFPHEVLQCLQQLH